MLTAQEGQRKTQQSFGKAVPRGSISCSFVSFGVFMSSLVFPRYKGEIGFFDFYIIPVSSS